GNAPSLKGWGRRHLSRVCPAAAGRADAPGSHTMVRRRGLRPLDTPYTAICRPLKRSPFTALCRQLAKLDEPSRADLHVHTTASDGAFTASQVVAHARQAGLAAVAVTDHDTFVGVA